jgi:hypothetical protein
MERLLTVRDIQERYSCTGPTARKYIRQMVHMENPLTVTQEALTDWENRRQVFRPEWFQTKTERTIVPRRRANR